LLLLSLAAFLSAFADRLLQLKLGSISLFLAPSGENLGAGVVYMLLPMALLLLPIALFFNDDAKRLKYLQNTMLLKALMAMILSLDMTREFLSDGGTRVGYSLSLIFLAGEWTVICMAVYLSQRAPRPLIYLSTLAAAYFCGQTLALVLAPYVVSQPFTNTFAAFAGTLYIAAFYMAKGCRRLGVTPVNFRRSYSDFFDNDTNHKPKSGATGPIGATRLLLATVILYTPLYVCLMLSLFYALQGYQVGALTFASLTAKEAMAFALGASASIFLHHLAGRRTVLQIIAAASVALAASGAASHSYDISLFTLMAVTALAGFITPDWENHLLSVLPPKSLAPFLAARNTIVMALIGLLSPFVEKTLPAVSALYVLKELNILILATALVAIIAAPFLPGRKRHTPEAAGLVFKAEDGLNSGQASLVEELV